MANEVYVSTQGDTLQSEVLAMELEYLLHESPMMRAVVEYDGDTIGSNSDTIKKGQLGDDDQAEAVAEGAAITDQTAITDDSYNITPARQSIKRRLSDLLAGVSAHAIYNDPVALAAYNYNALMRQFDALLTALLPSMTGSVGTSGVAATYTDYLDGKLTLQERKAVGDMFWVGHDEQWSDIERDLRNEVGPLQFDPASREALQTHGKNYMGRLNGIECYATSLVTTAGGDWRGGMFIKSAMKYGEGSPSPFTLGRDRIMAPGGVIYTDIDFDGDYADGILWSNYFVGVALAEADRGVTFLTVND